MPGSNPPYDNQWKGTIPPSSPRRQSPANLTIMLIFALVILVCCGGLFVVIGLSGGFHHTFSGTYNCSNCVDKTPMPQSVFMVSADEGWAVGAAGGQGLIVHYQNGQWMQIQAPAKTTPLTSVVMVSATDGWSVGEYGAILHYSNGKWSKVSSPTTEVLTSISMLSATEGWAVGPDGIIQAVNDVWTNVHTPQAITGLKSISMVSAHEGWAVGDNVIAHFRNGAWTTLDISPFPVSNLDLNQVVMVSASEGWAVGQALNQAVILHYQDGQWQLTDNPLTPTDTPAATPTTNPLTPTDTPPATPTDIPLTSEDTLTAVGMVSPDEGWAMGYEGTTSLILHYTRQSGWVSVTTPLRITFHSLSMTSASDGWAVGDRDEFVHYEDGAWC